MFLSSKVLSLLASAMMAASIVAQGSDYLDPPVAPATIYEDPNISPQNVDFDLLNNRFIAHAGWYQDRSIHYYKFRVYSPGTYPGLISPEGSSDDIPLQKVFLVTTDGGFDGVIGSPILEFHTQDGNSYSDFMAIEFVLAPDGYVADSYRSVGDIEESNATLIETEIVVNMPVVPNGSTLQHPTDKDDAAPIAPVSAFYRGVEVSTYVFEVTDQSAADFFAFTRGSSIATERAKLTTGFEIAVAPWYASPVSVSVIPLWLLNHFSRGVTDGVIGGGPNPAGMRNIIDGDRPDLGYSPLWHIFWATEMPIDFSADQVSSAVDASVDNGFAFFQTSIYINCPNIGLVPAELNAAEQEEFKTKIDLGMDQDIVYILGSHETLVLQPNILVTFKSDDGTVLGTTETNGMGGYEFALRKASVPEGAMKVKVVVNEEIIREIMVKDSSQEVEMPDMDDNDMDDSASSALKFGVVALSIAGFMFA